MEQRRLRALLALTTAGALTLSACAGGDGAADIKDESASYGLNAEGLPIVGKKLTLTFGGEKSALAPDYNGMQLVKQWEKDTNIHINWENLPGQVYQEKKNLFLASDDLPDVLFNTGLSDAETVQYGTNGTLVPLEDLIKEHAPILQGILDKRPDIKSALTASDGHIYTLPSVEELGILQYPNFLYINRKWLDQLGLAMPKTIDEYHAALQAFKTKDPNGNGKADELPLSFRTDSFCANPSDLIAALGGQVDNNEHRIVKDGKVEFTANTEGYKRGVEGLGQWYKAGLIDPESFSQDDTQYLAKGKANTPVLGSFLWWELKEFVGEDRLKDYEMVGVLEGVDGQRRAGLSNHQEIGRGAMAITRTNKYPVATIRWADRLFDPVMSAQTSWGPIGLTLQKSAQGVLVQIPARAGEAEGERRQKVAPGGPKITTKEDFAKVVAPEPRAKERQDLVQKYYAPHKANDQYPPVLLSNEELEKVSYPQTDINALVKEKFATWVVKGTIGAEWSGYLAQLDSMGIKDVIATYQAAHNRYQKAQQ